MTQRVVACVIERNGRLLVCQRPPHKRHGGLWEFPGGKVEPDETDDEAATRELLEELDLGFVRAGPPMLEVTDPDSPFTIAFVPVVARGAPKRLEHSAVEWHEPIRLLAKPLAPSDRQFVEYLLTLAPDVFTDVING